ncbi:MAG: ASCH domain-containing protein [Myxococcota bacterium]
MTFTKRLHAGIRSGKITCSVRIWQRPRVKAGGRYRFADGAVEVDSIRRIELGEVTPALARKSGFAGVVDLLKVAKHGPGENVYLVEFHFERGEP